jgi:hypothetical protein
LDFPRRHWDQDWYRLIPSRFPPVDVYERLAPELRAVAQETEALTNPRLAAKARLTGGPASVDENSPRLQNWNHAPFAYTNPEGSYLLSPVHGVMEVAGSEEAALAIAIRRREIFLGRTTELALDLDMRLLSTRIAGEFADLTGLALVRPGGTPPRVSLPRAGACRCPIAPPARHREPMRYSWRCSTRRCWGGACRAPITGSCGTGRSSTYRFSSWRRRTSIGGKPIPNFSIAAEGLLRLRHCPQRSPARSDNRRHLMAGTSHDARPRLRYPGRCQPTQERNR